MLSAHCKNYKVWHLGLTLLVVHKSMLSDKCLDLASTKTARKLAKLQYATLIPPTLQVSLVIWVITKHASPDLNFLGLKKGRFSFLPVFCM